LVLAQLGEGGDGLAVLLVNQISLERGHVNLLLPFRNAAAAEHIIRAEFEQNSSYLSKTCHFFFK
jgi:hypothetical protein